MTNKECPWVKLGKSVNLEIRDSSATSDIEIDKRIKSLMKKSDQIRNFSKSTNLHENLHKLQHIALPRDIIPLNKVKLIYCCGQHGFLVNEPSILTKDIVIPISIKNKLDRVKNYVDNRPNDPLAENIVDEWNAFLTGAQGNIAWKDRSDTIWDVDSSMDFFMINSYAIIKVKDIQYSDFEQYKIIYRMLVDKTIEVWQDAREWMKGSRSENTLKEFWNDETVCNGLYKVFDSELVLEIARKMW